MPELVGVAHRADRLDLPAEHVKRQREHHLAVHDEPAPASEWLPYLAACAGAKPPRRIPAWLARLLAGDMAVGMMTEGRGFCNAKAKRELGWELRYPSWRQGFKEEFG